MPRPRWPLNRQALYDLGVVRAKTFCELNKLPVPEFRAAPKKEWPFDACAYYRPEHGIVVCVELCARPCSDEEPRAWSWPGNSTDRTPYGVVAHELGHHVDWYSGRSRSKFYSEYGGWVREESKGEKPLTSYCPNDAEWFAEMFRLFVTNPALLRYIRPLTCGLLNRRFKSIGSYTDWKSSLGPNVPAKILPACVNKGAPRCI